MRGIVLCALVASACSFSPGAFTPPGDAMPDGPPPITVSFAKTTTMADEDSGVVQVRVVLSQPSDGTITVNHAITGGTATPTVDFTGGEGTLTFAAGDVEEIIEITIGPDGMEEPDETIELTLSAVAGTGAGLGAATHTITIAANVLPRVAFEMATSMGAESTSPTINAVLSVASALTTSVQVAVMSGTATGGGDDYTLATATVTFNPGETTKPVTLTVVDDTRDEDAETVTLELTNAVNLIVGAQGTTTHTIEDNDSPPTVSFAAASSQIAESGTMTNLVVTLSTQSGKTIDVPFTADPSSVATLTADYTFGTASPLTFAPGEVQKMIQVNVVDDTAVEGNENLVVALGAATNATVGTPGTHTLTIVDNDATCVGTGATALCFATPTAPVTITGAFDTSNGNAMCASTAPLSGWTGGPDSCFVVGTNVTIQATTVTGPRPLVVFASGNITVTGDVDASSHIGGGTGPGASAQVCSAARAPANSTSGAGGGAGGTFRTKGGDGGEGNNAMDSGGVAGAVGALPTVLRAGCRGSDGGKGNSGGGNNAGVGGFGGGAIYLAAAGMLTINNGVLIHANGAGADAQTAPNSGFFAGGGGGGSGGMIKLFAQTFAVSGARLMANGGGGSSGGDSDTAGDDGDDPALNNVTNSGAGGNINGDGGSGGNGWGGTTAAQNGGNGSSNNAGGGGGGGGGLIQSNAALTGAQTSAGEIVTQ